MDISFRLGLLAVVACATLSGCATAPPGTDINDPYEATNRRIHEFNKRFDTAVVRPASQLTGDGPPGPVSQGIVNLATNFEAPGVTVNHLLQGDVVDAGHTAFRFALNTTLGVAGVFDPASSFGLERRATDFGVTLAQWGVAEGAYQELPFLGPSTERDTAGWLLDFFLNPLGYVVSPEARALGYTADFAEDVVERGTISDTYDSILYESADSYAQARTIYLQNRRFELGVAGDGSAVDGADIYDPYAELGIE